jgi:nucleoside-diphosphate-sugar epimerase
MSEIDRLEPNNEYGITKASATLYASFLGKKFNLPIYTFRLFAVYGSYEDKTRLIPSLILPYLNAQVPQLSKPDSVRDFIFIDDVIKYYLNIDQLQGDFGGIYNIGTGQQHSLGVLAQLVQKIAKSEQEPLYGSVSVKQNEPNHWLADMTKTNHTFTITSTPLEMGVQQSFEWFRKHQFLYH